MTKSIIAGARLRAIWRFNFAVLVLFAFSSAFPATAADYLLSPGDTLELVVLDVFHEPQKAAIGIDGLVSFPLVGDVRAAGRTLKDVRSDIRDALTRQPLRRPLSEPGSSTYSITPNDVSLQIAEFRPVYVSGDVAHPGQVAYHPGLTVRQAVATAGGYGRERSEDKQVDLLTKLDRASLDFATASLEVHSIEAELGRSNAQGAYQDLNGVDPSVLKSIKAVQDERRAARQQAFDTKRTFLNLALELSRHRIEALQSQVESEQKGADLDAAEVTSVDELFHKGLVAATRLTEVRRSSLLSSSRALQTKVAIEDAKRDAAESQSKLDDLEHERQVQLLTDLEKANENMRNSALELGAARRALAVNGDVSAGVQIHIFRNGSDAAHADVADEEAQLQPGDTVAISIIRGYNEAVPQKSAGP